MKHLGFRFKTLALTLLLSCVASSTYADIFISRAEMEEICSSPEAYASLDCAVAGNIIETIQKIKALTPEECWSPEFCALCKRIEAGCTTAPQAVLEKALEYAYETLEQCRCHTNDINATKAIECLSECYIKLMNGDITITRSSNDEERAPRPNPVLPQDDSIDPQAQLNLPRDLNIERDGQFGGNLRVRGNAVIDGDLTVRGDSQFDGSVNISGGLTVGGDVILPTPLFTGDVTIRATAGNNDVCIIFQEDDGLEKARLCTSATENEKGLYVSVDGGTTENFRVTDDGSVIIEPSTLDVALTVNGLAGGAAVGIFPGTNSIGLQIADAGTAAEIDFTGTPARINAAGVLDFTYAAGISAVEIQSDGVVKIANGAGAFLVPAAGDRLTVNGNIQISGNITNVSAGNQFLAVDGTAALPSYSFASAGNNDNGMYLPAADSLGFSTAGTQRILINSSGDVTVNTPDAGIALTVNGFAGSAAELITPGTNSIGLQIGDSGTAAEIDFTGTTAQINAAGDLDFTRSGTNALEIQSNGIVKVANQFGDFLAPEPGDRLTVNGSIRSGGRVFASEDFNANNPTYSFLINNDTGMYLPATQSLGFSTAGTHRMDISSTGDVTIENNLIYQNTTAPLRPIGSRDAINNRLMAGFCTAAGVLTPASFGSVSHVPGSGVYIITFTTPFTSTPVVVATADAFNGFTNVTVASTTGVTITTLANGGGAADAAFHIYAFGQD